MKQNNEGEKDKNLKFYITRHGETEWNVLKKFQGQLDSPLTEKGMEKINETGAQLKNVKFDGVYTSELQRTVKTAEIIMKKNVNAGNEKNRDKFYKLQKLKELNEVHFGKWQGMSYDEIFKKYPKEADNYFYNVKNYQAENIEAENLENALKRFLDGLNKIIQKHKNGNILVVTHGTVLEMFINYVYSGEKGEVNERKLIGNGEYRVFKYKKGKFLAI